MKRIKIYNNTQIIEWIKKKELYNNQKLRNWKYIFIFKQFNEYRKKYLLPMICSFVILGENLLKELVSDEDAILCDWCHMPFCTLLYRETVRFFLLDRIFSWYLTFLCLQKNIFFTFIIILNTSSLFKLFFYFYNDLIILIPNYAFIFMYITSFIIKNR